MSADTSHAVSPTSGTGWIAIAYGALDVSGLEFIDGAELVVVPTKPSAPLALPREGAELWRRLVDGPVEAAELDEGMLLIVHEMAEIGLASTDLQHPARVRDVSKPWLSSPMHELVYALVASVAREHGIGVVFIKGPVLHAQGIRSREHSGDVDLWVEPGCAERFAAAMNEWAWNIAPYAFLASTYHSLTMQPTEWGCELDVHFRFPGVAVAEDRAFAVLVESSVSYRFAGVESRVPSVGLHSVLHTLHDIRPVPGRIVKTEAVEASAVEVFARMDPEEIVAVCLDWGSLDILRPLLERAFPGRALPAEGGGIPDEWLWRSAPSRSRYYFRVLRSLPWRERLGAALQVLWPSDGVVRQSAMQAGDPNASVLRARVRRIRRGLRHLFKN